MDVKGAYNASQIHQLAKNPASLVDSPGSDKSASFKQRLVNLIPGHKQKVDLAGIRNFLQTNPDIKASGLEVDAKWLTGRDVQRVATAAIDLVFRAKSRGLETLMSHLAKSDLGPTISSEEVQIGIDAGIKLLRANPAADKDGLLSAAYEAIWDHRIEKSAR